MGHGSVAHKDVSAPTPNIGAENMRQIQGRMGGKRHHTSGPARGYPARRKETVNSDLGRHLTAMGCQGQPERSATTPNDGASRTRKETARSKVRTMWCDESDRPHRSPSYSGIKRPGKVPRTGKAEMGEDHGCQTPQDVDLVSNLSPGRSIWASTEWHTKTTW